MARLTKREIWMLVSFAVFISLLVLPRVPRILAIIPLVMFFSFVVQAKQGRDPAEVRVGAAFRRSIVTLAVILGSVVAFIVGMFILFLFAWK